MIKNFVPKILLVLLTSALISPMNIFAQETDSYWEIQSIDTMKFSRDLARERNGDEVFRKIIETNVQKIADVGANYVAIGTPYDEEFLPYLKVWVHAVRSSGLKVWFRGNLSGWEGWFDYPSVSPQDHIEQIEEFIVNNSDLFEDGDIFTSCTECENGVLGDPRETKDVDGFREFLIREYEISKAAFEKTGIKVTSGYYSMNADVAWLVMDKETTKALGGIVVIDHYVKDPEKLASDVNKLAQKSEGEVVLGEIGVPVPDIHGVMTDEMQARWIEAAFSALSKESKLKGVNYWVSFSGTTAIWNADGSEKPVVSVIKSYFLPDTLSGIVVNKLGRPVKNSLVIADAKSTHTDDKGMFRITSNPTLERIVVNASSYKDKAFQIGSEKDLGDVTLEKEKESVFFKVGLFFKQVGSSFLSFFN